MAGDKKTYSIAEIQAMKNGGLNKDTGAEKSTQKENVTKENVVAAASTQKANPMSLSSLTDMIVNEAGIVRETIDVKKLGEGKVAEAKVIKGEELEVAKELRVAAEDALGDSLGNMIGNMDNVMEKLQPEMSTVKTIEVKDIAPEVKQETVTETVTPDIIAQPEEKKEILIESINGGKDINVDLEQLGNKMNNMMVGMKEETKEEVAAAIPPEHLNAMKNLFEEYGRDMREALAVYGKELEIEEKTAADSIKDARKNPINISSEAVNKKVIGMDKRSVSVLDSIKALRKRGSSSIGYLPASNLVVRIYSIDTPFIKEHVVRGIQTENTTMFKDKLILTDILERTVVISRDGNNLTVDELMSIIHLEDLEDLLMVALISATPNGVLKEFPIICKGYTEEEKDEAALIDDKGATLEMMMNYDCNKKYMSDLDINLIQTEATTQEILARFKGYQRTKSTEQLLVDSKAGKEYIVTYNDYDKGVSIVAEMAPPTLADYFETSQKVKEYVIEELVKKDNILNYISDENIMKVPFRTLSLDEKIILLASTFPTSYRAVVPLIQLVIYIRGFQILPLEYAEDPSADIADYIDEIITISRDEHDMEVIKTMMMELNTEMLEMIGEKSDEMSFVDRPQFKITSICTHCGKKNEETFFPSQLFFAWAYKTLTLSKVNTRKK